MKILMLYGNSAARDLGRKSFIYSRNEVDQDLADKVAFDDGTCFYFRSLHQEAVGLRFDVIIKHSTVDLGLKLNYKSAKPAIEDYMRRLVP